MITGHIRCWGSLDATYSTIASELPPLNSLKALGLALPFGTYNRTCIIIDGTASCWSTPYDQIFTPMGIGANVKSLSLSNITGYAIVNGDLYKWTENNTTGQKMIFGN